MLTTIVTQLVCYDCNIELVEDKNYGNKKTMLCPKCCMKVVIKYVEEEVKI